MTIISQKWKYEEIKISKTFTLILLMIILEIFFIDLLNKKCYNNLIQIAKEFVYEKRVFLAAGVAVLSAAVLAACSSGNANKEANKPVTYAYVFSSDPSTLDYTVSGNVNTKQITGNVIDGLLENDQYGNLVPSVAEDWTVSKDGLNLYL